MIFVNFAFKSFFLVIHFLSRFSLKTIIKSWRTAWKISRVARWSSLVYDIQTMNDVAALPQLLASLNYASLLAALGLLHRIHRRTIVGSDAYYTIITIIVISPEGVIYRTLKSYVKCIYFFLCVRVSHLHAYYR